MTAFIALVIENPILHIFCSICCLSCSLY